MTEQTDDEFICPAFGLFALDVLSTGRVRNSGRGHAIGNRPRLHLHFNHAVRRERRQFLRKSGVEQIWACSVGRMGMIKRLRPMADGGVKILSDNPSVPEETAYDGELALVGRVVAVVRKM